MWRVTCKQCGASVITPDGNSDALACPCCPEPHSHEERANACPDAELPVDQRHGMAACAHPSEDGTGCNHLTPNGTRLGPPGPPEPCPGGHCWPGMPGCTVCRPCDVEWLGQVLAAPAAVVQA